jgi:hypothetical protein
MAKIVFGGHGNEAAGLGAWLCASASLMGGSSMLSGGL